MKRITIGFLVLAVLSVGSAFAGSPVHAVTGSGTVAEGGLTFKTNVAIFSDSEGAVWGEIVTQVNSEDIMHAEGEEFFPAGTTCSDEFEIFDTVVSHGDFKVR